MARYRLSVIQISPSGGAAKPFVETEKGISLQRDAAVEEPAAGMRRLRAGDDGSRPRGDVGAVHKRLFFENELRVAPDSYAVFRLALQIHRPAPGTSNRQSSIARALRQVSCDAPLARFLGKTHRSTVTSGESVRFSSHPVALLRQRAALRRFQLHHHSSRIGRRHTAHLPCHAGRSTFACISARTSPTPVPAARRALHRGGPSHSSRSRARPGRAPRHKSRARSARRPSGFQTGSP